MKIIKKVIITQLIVLLFFYTSFATSTFKPYMDYRTITDKTSKQYKLQQGAWTDGQGFRRYKNYYMVAIGQGWKVNVGETRRMRLSSGQDIYVVVADVKKNKHTDKTNKYDCKGGVLEFIVDKHKISRKIRRTGDVTHSGFNGIVTGVYK